jgi:thiol:disulfide interchange protein DsbD
LTRFLVFLLALLFQLPAFSATASQDLLPEEQAFVFTATLATPTRIVTGWDIADGYYIYRDKFGFEISGL